ncbi:MAG TPA: hypothetical protein DEW39_04000 [Brevibacterium sp.]|uniref:Chitin-binding type-3 domain-containing protein n=2 Tax=Brevibacterium TaxID=1696 RepID=A0A2H1KZL4_9MICO|nr:carbohydrate-binding protein [Brevibacterium antiquum]SMY05108.1 hypothetical protein BANT918_03266 [Brevibacterium antiquum CNRZ 918]HCG55318.1 hypothetical protein [Brevibacterium sp.]
MIDTELERRKTLATAGQKLDTIVREVLTAEGVEQGEEWESGKSYPKSWTVTRDGITYTSQIPNNVWPPGDTNDPQTGRWWKPETTDEAAEENIWAEWVDVVVGEVWEYEGDDYKVLQAHTTQPGWEPPNAPALWEKVK